MFGNYQIAEPLSSFFIFCISKGIVSPLTAKVKYPHYEGQSEFESEAVERRASVEDGIGGTSFIEGGQ